MPLDSVDNRSHLTWEWTLGTKTKYFPSIPSNDLLINDLAFFLFEDIMNSALPRIEYFLEFLKFHLS